MSVVLLIPALGPGRIEAKDRRRSRRTRRAAWGLGEGLINCLLSTCRRFVTGVSLPLPAGSLVPQGSRRAAGGGSNKLDLLYTACPDQPSEGLLASERPAAPHLLMPLGPASTGCPGRGPSGRAGPARVAGPLPSWGALPGALHVVQLMAGWRLMRRDGRVSADPCKGVGG